MRSTSEDVEPLNRSDPADTVPAFLSHLSEVLHAVKISWHIFSFHLSGFLANSKSFVDIIDAGDFRIKRAVIVVGDGLSFFEEREGASKCDKETEDNNLFHVDLLSIFQ